MAETTSELRTEIDDRRDSIAGTVDQIENRVSPSRIAARRTGRMRRRLSDMADTVFGNDEPERPYGQVHPTPESDEGGLADRAKAATDQLNEAPDQLRRRARGNPAAAGMISFGIGLLLGSVLPESRREQRLADEAQPQLNDAAERAAAAGQTVMEDVKEPAKQAAEQLKESAASAGREVTSEAKAAASDVSDEAQR